MLSVSLDCFCFVLLRLVYPMLSVSLHHTQTNTTQYVLDTTILKQTQHNMCWTPPYSNKHNTICVGHHHTQQVPCCDVHYDFPIDMIFGSSLPPVVCGRLVSCLRYLCLFIWVWWCPTHIVLCLFEYGGVQHILCCVCLSMVVFNTYCVSTIKLSLY
jgi:hypothetical protein